MFLQHRWKKTTFSISLWQTFVTINITITIAIIARYYNLDHFCEHNLWQKQEQDQPLLDNKRIAGQCLEAPSIWYHWETETVMTTVMTMMVIEVAKKFCE